MFDNIKKCLSKYEESVERASKGSYYFEYEEADYSTINYFTLHFAEAIMEDSSKSECEKLAKVLFAMLGLSNNVNVEIK